MDNEKVKVLEKEIQELNERITKLEAMILVNTKSIKDSSTTLIVLAMTVIFLSIKLMSV